MIEVIQGKKSEFMTFSEIKTVASGYKKVILDLGTGDGKFVYENAKNIGGYFWLGIDPNRSALEKYSAKIYKKESKGGLSNAMYIISSIETLPEEMNDFFDEIYINYPWGSLLKHTVQGSNHVIKNLVRVAKNKSRLTMYFNYNSKYEPTKMEELEIPDLSDEYINNIMIPKYKSSDIQITSYKQLGNEDIKSVNAKWGKKLAFGRERAIWEIRGTIQKVLDPYTFLAKGHENILAEHVKTIEITKDDYLTTRGDCIIGIKADFKLEELKKFSGWVDVTLESGSAKDSFKTFVNPEFSSDHELVFRKSKVNTERTFGINANKSAHRLNKKLIEKLRDGSTLTVTISPREKRVHKNKYSKH